MIPVGRTVTTATLRLYGTYNVGGPASLSTTVGAYEASHDGWTETGVTWANRPARAASAVDAETVATGDKRWHEWDVTSLVGAALAGDGVASIAVAAIPTRHYVATFHSDEAAAGRPQLALELAEPAPPPSAPSAPIDFRAASVTSTGVTLAWTDTSDNEKGFRLYRAQDDPTQATLLAQLDKNVESFEDTDVTAGSTYFYFLVAFNDDGATEAADSSPVIVSAVNLPSAPTDLVLSSASPTSVLLTWTDTSDNEEGFRVYRTTHPDALAHTAHMTLVDTPGPNVESFTDATVSPDTTYYYVVAAYDNNGAEAATPGDEVRSRVTTPPASANLPVVSVTATDPTAAEAGQEPGVFTFTRAGGDLAAGLEVSYTIAGTATPGGDHDLSSGTLLFGENEPSKQLVLTPVDDAEDDENETVVLTLTGGGGGYTIASGGNMATVTIEDDDDPPTPQGSGVDLDVFEDVDGDGVHDDSPTSEADEVNGVTFAGVASEDLTPLVVNINRPDDLASVAIAYDETKLAIFLDSLGAYPYQSGNSLQLSLTGREKAQEIFYIGTLTEEPQANSPLEVITQPRTASNSFAALQVRGQLQRWRRQDPPEPDVDPEAAWRDGDHDNEGGLDDGDGNQRWTERDGFWASSGYTGAVSNAVPPEYGYADGTTLVLGFAGHTQSDGVRGDRGRIWNVDQLAGLDDIAEDIYDEHPEWAITLFPEDPGNHRRFSTTRDGDGVIGPRNPERDGRRVSGRPQAGEGNVFEPTGAGEFLVDAILRRGVQRVGMFGYSHGGGSIDVLFDYLAWRAVEGRAEGLIQALPQVDFFFAGFIDAVDLDLDINGQNINVIGRPQGETDLPIGTANNAGATTFGARWVYNVWQDQRLFNLPPILVNGRRFEEPLPLPIEVVRQVEAEVDFPRVSPEGEDLPDLHHGTFHFDDRVRVSVVDQIHKAWLYSITGVEPFGVEFFE